MGKEKEQDLLEQFTRKVITEGADTLESGRVVLHVMPERVIAEIRNQIEFCMRYKAGIESRIKHLRHTEIRNIEAEIRRYNQALQDTQNQIDDLIRQITEFEKDPNSIRNGYTVEYNTHLNNTKKSTLNLCRDYLSSTDISLKSAQAKREQLEKELQELELELEKLNKDNLIDRYQSMILKLLEVITKDSI